MISIQFSFFAGLFLLFAFSRVVLRFREGIISWREFIFWTTIWAAAALVVLYPGYSADLALRIGIGRGSDAVVYIAIILLFYLMFRIYVSIGALRREITQLVRVLAIDRAEDTSPGHKKAK